MAKKVILAVAGAGKTYHICHEINPDKRNLILAFTHENIYNIQKELCAAQGRVPERTTVATFDSFVYHQFILPYEPSIAEHFDCPKFVSRGICTIDPPPMRIKGRGGTMFPNPYYIKKDEIAHYITDKLQYYCATLAELVLQVKQRRESLIKRVATRLNLFYDYVLIDEFQDFREYDYELIMELAKHLNNILLVGDFHQHSVSATNNSGKPFNKKNVAISYEEFVVELENAGFEVDLTTLEKSRRCSAEVCQFVTRKLGIKIESYGDNAGSVIWVDENAKNILANQQIVKLVYSEAANYSFKAINWSYSKGDTMDEACVILTDALENLDSEDYNPERLKPSTLNKLYVAMTRSSGNLYIMKASTFKQIKTQYMKY